MTMVGGFLGDEFELSKLYDSHFTTGYRQGKD
jgi:precorrin-4/cobalt-precorrin-4 C11-methyltransferase